MEHAASSSLISLGLSTEVSSEESPFRWGLGTSIALHALVIALAMFVRFQSDSEQPFRTIDVALISLPAMPTSAPKPAPSTTKKTVAPTGQKVAPSPAPTAPPIEDTLPPLPTETALERLSESLGGAINSILVPQKREMNSSTIPTQKPELLPSEDQSPLLDNLRLPSAPPTIARPKRLQPTEPLNIPSTRTPPPASVPKKTPAPSKPESLPSPTLKPRIQSAVKPAPTIPSLSEVTPFKKPEQAKTPPETLQPSQIEESLKRNLPNIQTPASRPNVPKISRERSTPQLKPKSSAPHVSAPQLAKIPETPRPNTPIPTQPKMSDTVKKLMEGLKSTTRTPTSNKVPPQPTKPSMPTPPPPSAIDQRIAKLSIPDVAPVESIKQRLQLLNMQATGSPGSSASNPSPGKNRYLAMVEDTIDRHWVAPPLLSSTPLVVLKFRISRSGEISRIHMEESSGHAHYDSAAQRAVQAVNPLPPFPSDISESFFEVQYRFIKD